MYPNRFTGWRFAKMFSAMLSDGTSESSWKTMEIPWRTASCGDENVTGRPSRRIVPWSGW